MKLEKTKLLKKIGINQQQTAGGQRLMRQAAVVLAVSFALGAGQVSAGKKGPRASVHSATECTLDFASGADLVITTTLTNKSSGGVIAELRNGSEIKGTFKKKAVPGKANYFLDASPEYFFPQPPIGSELKVSASFNLCTEMDNVKKARELNGEATMFYGISGGGGETRKVVNRCTDNPDISGNQGGIKVTHAIFNLIEKACGW